MDEDYFEDFEMEAPVVQEKGNKKVIIAILAVALIFILIAFGGGLAIGILFGDTSSSENTTTTISGGNYTSEASSSSYEEMSSFEEVSSSSISPSASPSRSIPSNTPQEFWETISLPKIENHLASLQEIANENGGTRSLSSPGFNASIDFVYSQLAENTDYILTIQPFTVNMTVQIEEPIFQMISPTANVYTYWSEYTPLQFSGAGNATALTDASALEGCNSSDFENFESGRIALIARGNCSFHLKAINALEAGAVSVLIYNYQEESDPTRGTLGEFIPAPVFGVSYSLGQELISTPSVMNMFYNSVLTTIYTSNLIAETPAGNEDDIVIIGSHLDSVDAGPGINDNGSGSSANLQIALQFAEQMEGEFTNKVRFIWYGAEEEGLLGSTYYVSSLSEEEQSKVALNLNFDMLGSPNFIRGILNGTDSTIPGSAVIQNVFIDFFDMNDLTYDIIPFTGRSDYGPYLAAGIAAGGVETGAELIKDEEGRIKFGGLANAPYDPCYHQACDTIENVNTEVLLQCAQAAAYGLQTFSTKENLRDFLNSQE